MLLNKKELRLFLTFFIIYAYFAHWGGWSENSAFYLTRAIVEEHRFEIDTYHNYTSDRAYYNEHYYSDKAPGMSFLAVPVYATFKFIYYTFFPESFIKAHAASNETWVRHVSGNVPIATQLRPGFFLLTSMFLVTIFTSSLFSALTVVLVYKISRFFTENEKYRLSLAFTYGLGTLAFPSALLFSIHSTGTFFIFLAFYLLFKMKREGHNYLHLAGVSAGIAVICDYPTILLALVFSAGVILSKKSKALPFLLGFFIGISPLLAYNYSTLGNPLNVTLQYNDPAVWKTSLTELKYYGFTSLIPNHYTLLRLTIFPYRGLFYYYPILLLSIIGLRWMYAEHRTETVMIVSIFILYLFTFSTRNIWAGGYTFGPRYLHTIIPFLMLPLIYSFKKINFKFVLVLISISVFVNLLGLQMFEDWIVDSNTLFISSKYQQKHNSYQVLRNPLFEHYIPLFKKYGPRSRVFESLWFKKGAIDIRDSHVMTEDYPSFLGLLPISFLTLIIWKFNLKKLKK